jgi:hypothetical protein
MSNAEFNPRVVRAQPALHHFRYLTAPNGDWLASADGKSLHTQGWVDDQAIWDVQGDEFTHCVTGLGLAATNTDNDQPCELQLHGKPVGEDGSLGDGAVFTVCHGPEKLPSEYLQTLRDTGWVALTGILSASILDGLQRVGCVEAYEGTVPARVTPLAQDAAIARVTVEPVSLWLTREYMQTRDIRLGHPPSVSALPPDDGKREVQGWHTDFPYLWGTGDRIPLPSGDLVLGMQRNVCVSDFTRDNGATIFKLGSHESNAAPPTEWGVTNVTFRQGYRAEHGLPYAGSDTQVIEAPAGSIVLYDARTWHRAGANLTDRKRGAMIQAIIPAYIIPFMDTSATFKAFLESDAYQQVNPRERHEVDKLMVHKIRGPAGMFAISVDDDLTQRARAQSAPEKSAY